MNSVKLPLAPVWRLFVFEGVENWIILRWLHAGRPNLKPAEQYILDVGSSQHGDELAGEIYWTFDESNMELVSTLLIDAQEDEAVAVTMAWIAFDPDVHRPTPGQLADRFRRRPRLDDAAAVDPPHVFPRRKGADHAE